MSDAEESQQVEEELQEEKTETEEKTDTEEKTEKEEKTENEEKPKQKEKEKEKEKRPASKLDKKTQKMIADLQRCKKQMVETRRNTHRPPTREFTPDIFNSLSPYYNTYIVNYIVHELENPDPQVLRTGWGHRAMALGVIDPEISWKMDNFPGPVQPSRIPGTLFKARNWSRNLSGKDGDLGSTRLPPLPMPSVPKFHQATFQPNKMTFNELGQFRSEMKNMTQKLAEKRSKEDYDRTVKDWQRMNLSELKDLPAHSRYHVKKAIFSYLATSQGSAKALKPLTKELQAHTPEPLVK
ncbi:uncharacterized protein LOC5503752 [Nematostella vectensis]|uniref:uncharacterized protein LOC5503752 n=1 Tax=Nematostella vectensis TaxID=45351 RepID=UPI002076E044|nr:uncharacterized protein LOC5503752 [Nematostella vectensis]XP_048590478.1 uncharacterized protein LOC5503752 [Nematostella vectensis]XP_048590479.1 uncharacterized protein LOC5503752 [Nematostella vectensis]